jgi:hypothetical protein
LCRSGFGGENRRVVVAVRSSQAGGDGPFGEAVIDRLSVSGVVPGSSTNEIPGGFTRVLTSPHHNWYYHAWA